MYRTLPSHCKFNKKHHGNVKRNMLGPFIGSMLCLNSELQVMPWSQLPLLVVKGK